MIGDFHVKRFGSKIIATYFMIFYGEPEIVINTCLAKQWSITQKNKKKLSCCHPILMIIS